MPSLPVPGAFTGVELQPVGGQAFSIDFADGDPVTTASVDAATDYAYTIGFVPAGNDVVACTCDTDDATQDADAADAAVRP